MSDRHDDYPFDLVQKDFSERPEEARNLLRRRPFVRFLDTLEEGANHFAPGDRLEDAVNTALAVGSPLLMTGQAGTGKTQAAYWAARRLGLGEVLHFQVKSTSTARDLLYTFDTVRYFHDANIQDAELASRRRYLEPGMLWRAIDPGVDGEEDEDSNRRTAAPSGPRLLLIDEIDKAPRDFPNDLLHELN
ncbi:MAG: AAA family ATPase, partial [Acidobacteriota bacterium]